MPAGTGVSISWCVKPTRKRTRRGRERRPAYRRERHQQSHRVHALVVRRHNPRCFYLPVRIRRGRRTGRPVPPGTSAYEPSVQLVNCLTPESVPSLPLSISPFTTCRPVSTRTKHLRLEVVYPKPAPIPSTPRRFYENLTSSQQGAGRRRSSRAASPLAAVLCGRSWRAGAPAAGLRQSTGNPPGISRIPRLRRCTPE